MNALRTFLIEAVLVVSASASAYAASRWLPDAAPLAVPQIEPPPSPGVNIAFPAFEATWAKPRIARALGRGIAVVFGSSELSFAGENAIQWFYPYACGKDVVAVGRAGFQLLLVMMTLAEARDQLGPWSDVTVILSPQWFIEYGTPTGALLKNVEPETIRSLLMARDLPAPVREALNREIRIHRDEFTGLYPDWALAWLPGFITRVPAPRATPPVVQKQTNYDWAAGGKKFRAIAEKAGAGNPYGVSESFWRQWLGRRTYPIPARKLDPFGIEMRDLFALSRFLREKGVRAKFIMQPIHRRLFSGLEPYDRLFAGLGSRLAADGHRYLDLFTEPYDNALLDDAVHFGTYGFFKVQEEMCR